MTLRSWRDGCSAPSQELNLNQLVAEPMRQICSRGGFNAPSAQWLDKGGNIGQAMAWRGTHLQTLRQCPQSNFPPTRTMVGHVKAVKPSESEDQ
jgi:hypothetical protein